MGLYCSDVIGNDRQYVCSRYSDYSIKTIWYFYFHPYASGSMIGFDLNNKYYSVGLYRENNCQNEKSKYDGYCVFIRKLGY